MRVNPRPRPRIVAVAAAILIALVSASTATGAHAETTGETTNGTTAALSAVTEGPFMLVNAHSGRCLNVAGGSRANGADIIQYDCYNASNQPFSNNLWYRTSIATGAFYVWAYHSGLCVNVQGGSLANGANVIQYTCVDHRANRWRLVPWSPQEAGTMP